jgi:peptidoglycan/LPS O-acetylase OafA/YrhL
MSRESVSRLGVWSPRIAGGAGLFLAGMIAAQRHFNFWLSPVPMLTVGISALVLLFAAIIGCCITTRESGPFNRALAAPWLCSFGKYSYAIYIFHATIIELLWPIFTSWTGFVRHQSVFGELLFTFAAIATSYAIAFASWHVWENQFLKLKRFFPLSGSVVRSKSATACAAIVAPPSQ